jgi:hypothetical protein
MMILYVSNQPKSLCVPTSGQICISVSQSIGSSKSVNKRKNSLLSDDLLQGINDTMFDNPFTNQQRLTIISLVTMKMIRH